MANIIRARAVISGTSGLPGIWTVYFDAGASPGGTHATEALARVRACIEAMKSVITTAVTNSYDGRVVTIDDSNGHPNGAAAVPPPAATVGTSATAELPKAAQALLVDQTGDVINARRVVGRHFIAGLTQSTLGTNGVVSAATQALILAGGLALRTNIVTPITHCVWHRPKTGFPGVHSTVIGSFAPPEFAVLRGRRD